jgi:NAD(P)-dependent dehydrogenase (short-subunit alcohol dehydrogenase family)
MKLDGKAALVTGGTSGIGLATARLFRDVGPQAASTRQCENPPEPTLPLGRRATQFLALSGEGGSISHQSLSP